VTIEDGAGQVSDPADAAYNWDYQVTQRNFELDPRVVLTPTNGRVGSKATVKCYDFRSGAQLQTVTIGGKAPTLITPGLPQALETKDSWNTLDDLEVEITVPLNIGGGAKEVKATDSAGETAKATYTVAKPTLTLTPTTGGPGDTLTIVGTNFGARKGPGNVRFAPDNGGQLLLEAVDITDSAGSFSVSFKVPAGAKSGYNKVSADIQGTTASTNFLVAARVAKVTPDRGPKGIEVTVSAKDLTPAAVVTSPMVTIGGWQFDEWPGDVTITTLGDFPVTTVTIPMGVDVGSNKITVDDQTLVAEGNFEVTQPTIKVNPERGYMGDTLVVEGAGWIPAGEELVTLRFNNKSMLTAEPDANGNFKGRFTVPLNAVDSNKITAEDGYTNEAAPVFFYKEDPELTVDPQDGAVGSEFMVKGKGFQPQFPIEKLELGGATIKPITGLVTDEFGAFEVEATVPGLAKGSYTVLATDKGGVEITTFFTIVEEEDTVVDALENIIDNVVIVWGYVADEWLFFDPDDPASDLVYFSVGAGYWIDVDADCELIYGGSSYQLTEGWTNIGWLGK
jgi:hypothetical protein